MPMPSRPGEGRHQNRRKGQDASPVRTRRNIPRVRESRARSGDASAGAGRRGRGRHGGRRHLVGRLLVGSAAEQPHHERHLDQSPGRAAAPRHRRAGEARCPAVAPDDEIQRVYLDVGEAPGSVLFSIYVRPRSTRSAEGYARRIAPLAKALIPCSSTATQGCEPSTSARSSRTTRPPRPRCPGHAGPDLPRRFRRDRLVDLRPLYRPPPRAWEAPPDPAAAWTPT